MPNTRYRKGKLYAADMAMYSRQIQSDNSQEISRLKRNLIRALREDVTAKQREMMLLYYAEGKNMREIGDIMGIDKSTATGWCWWRKSLPRRKNTRAAGQKCRNRRYSLYR